LLNIGQPKNGSRSAMIIHGFDIFIKEFFADISIT